MFNRLLAACIFLALGACAPSPPKIDRADPFKALYPWNHKWQGIQKTEHGVEYILIAKGDGKGPHPAVSDRVEVQYDGRLADNGMQFDSSYGGEPAEFRLNQVIPGWTEGLQKMQPGDEFMFWIPADQGYGKRGARGAIPPNANLMFRVELKSVSPALTPDAAAWKKVSPWPANSGDVTHLPSGLEYVMVQSGPASGAPPHDYDTAEVQYESRLDDGTIAATTFDDQQAQHFDMDKLTPGWSEALRLMRPGDDWMVRMPAALLYGSEGDGRIPANAPTTWEIRLISVQPGVAPDPTTQTPAADKAQGALGKSKSLAGKKASPASRPKPN